MGRRDPLPGQGPPPRTFTDELAAAVAYDQAAQQWYGQHARLNFPDGVDAWLAAEAASGNVALSKAA